MKVLQVAKQTSTRTFAMNVSQIYDGGAKVLVRGR
jgi:hypothetical protein